MAAMGDSFIVASQSKLVEKTSMAFVFSSQNMGILVTSNRHSRAFHYSYELSNHSRSSIIQMEEKSQRNRWF